MSIPYNALKVFFQYNLPSYAEKKKKYYINSRVGWWNDRDIHGGDTSPAPSYAIRIDGIFTDEFRKQIGLDDEDLYKVKRDFEEAILGAEVSKFLRNKLKNIK